MPEHNSATPTIVPAAVQTETPHERGGLPAAPSRGVGMTLLTGLSWLLLLDAAVETFLAGAPVRWIVGATVAAYLALSWLMRRRLTLRMHASSSLLLLLGLLAFTAWRPDGTIAGMVMLRQSTSTVLASATTLAVLLSGWALVRRKALPSGLRIAIGALAIYGVSATIWGVVVHTPFPALLHGGSLWTRLPFWLQGAFIGALVIVPLGLLAQTGMALVGAQAGSRGRHALLATVSALAIAVAAAGFFASAGAGGASIAASNRSGADGPGLKPLTIASLPLPVPRTIDLAHVAPEHFAAALGKDPLRIFEFVRDQVAYEAYNGCLRGPRGTLLAMAGNSVDRAALLAGLLTQSGQRVRYARATLPHEKASALVASLWAPRPSLAPSSGAKREPSPEIDAAAKNLLENLKRDDGLLREELKKAGLPSQGRPSNLPSLDAEAAEHYWVQWWRDGAWVDLDPSSATAAPGTALAPPAATFDTLPDGLFHRVLISVRLEEYTGDRPSTREALQYSARSADLSGVDLWLTHQAERQPPQDRGSALGGVSTGGGAAGRVGQLRPALLVPGRQITGQPFRLEAPARQSGAGFDSFLSGGDGGPAGPVAVAESITFEFDGPEGRRETIVREIFDQVGAARRRKGGALRTDEVVARSKASHPEDLAESGYDIFITTGAVHAGHLANLTAPPAAPGHEPIDFRAALQRINVLFSSMSDSLIGRIADGSGSVCRYYLDSPRIHIAEFSTGQHGSRLSLDLRRDQARVAGTGFGETQLFYAQVLRGVIDGTLERMVVDYFSEFDQKTDVSWAPTISTSSLFERARAVSTGFRLLATGVAGPGGDVPEEGRARIEEALAAGYVVFAPAKPVDVAASPRYAWWQVDPHSGATTAVTDEGLHQATVEMALVKNKDGSGYTVFTTTRGTEVAHAARFSKLSDAYRFGQLMFERLGDLVVEAQGFPPTVFM
jgi:hypothetical protein